MTITKHTKAPWTRTRSNGSYAPDGEAVEKGHNYIAVSDYTASLGKTPGVGYVKIMTDVVTPGFKERSGRGDLVFSRMHSDISHYGASSTPYVIDAFTVVPDLPKYPAGTLNWRYTSSGDVFAAMVKYPSFRVISGDLRLSFAEAVRLIPNRNFTDLEISRVIAEASTKANAIPSDAQLLVTLAELRATAMLLPGFVTDLAKLLRDVNRSYDRFWKLANQRRLAPTGADRSKQVLDILRREYEYLTNAYLSARFGLRPLVSDVMGIATALRNAGSTTVTDRHTSRGMSSISSFRTTSGVGSFGAIRANITEETNDAFSARGTVVWKAKLDLLDNLGVNVANIPLALVDLTAFSFVLNWIVNVNDFALAVGSALQPGWSKLGGCVTTRRETSTLYTLTGASLVSTSTLRLAFVSEPRGYIQTVSRKVSREPGVPPISLGLRSRPLAWTQDFRLLDAVALLSQQLKGDGVQRLLTLSRHFK